LEQQKYKGEKEKHKLQQIIKQIQGEIDKLKRDKKKAVKNNEDNIFKGYNL